MPKPPRQDPKARRWRATARSIRIPRPSAILCSPATRSSTPRISFRSATRWCAAIRSTACPSATSPHVFGVSRPTFYKAQECAADVGLAGLVPQPRGPKGGHKISAEVVAFVDELKAATPELTMPQCLAAIEARFGVKVHRRSLERALARKKKSTRPAVTMPARRTVDAYETIARRRAAVPNRFRRRISATLRRQGLAAWLEAVARDIADRPQTLCRRRRPATAIRRREQANSPSSSPASSSPSPRSQPMPDLKSHRRSSQARRLSLCPPVDAAPGRRERREHAAPVCAA